MLRISEFILNFVLNAVLADRGDLCGCCAGVVAVEKWSSAIPAHVVGRRTRCVFGRAAVDCNALCAGVGFECSSSRS